MSYNGQKRYRVAIYVDIFVPESDTVGKDYSRKDANFVANQVARQIEDKINPEWRYSERKYWIGNAYVGGIADTDSWGELLDLGRNDSGGAWD